MGSGAAAALEQATASAQHGLTPLNAYFETFQTDRAYAAATALSPRTN